MPLYPELTAAFLSSIGRELVKHQGEDLHDGRANPDRRSGAGGVPRSAGTGRENAALRVQNFRLAPPRSADISRSDVHITSKTNLVSATAISFDLGDYVPGL